MADSNDLSFHQSTLQTFESLAVLEATQVLVLHNLSNFRFEEDCKKTYNIKPGI
jgi:hypothetical protein